MSNYALALDTEIIAWQISNCVLTTQMNLSSGFPPLDVIFIKAIYQMKIKISTCRTSIKLHPHGNVSVPAPWTDTDVASLDTREQTMLHNAVFVSVTRKVL